MIVEVLCTLIEDLICFLFGKELFNDKQQKNQFLIPVFIAIHTLIVTFLNRISLVSQYTVIISSLIMGIMFYLLFQTKFIYCIMYAITYYMFVIVVEMFMICLLSVILGNPDYIFHVIQLSNFNRIVFALSMKLLNIILYLIARRKIRNINWIEENFFSLISIGLEELIRNDKLIYAYKIMEKLDKLLTAANLGGNISNIIKEEIMIFEKINTLFNYSEKNDFNIQAILEMESLFFKL